MSNYIDNIDNRTWTDLVSIGRLSAGEDYQVLRPEGREDSMILYTLSGNGFIGGGSLLESGDACIFLPGCPHSYRTGNQPHWELIWVHVHTPARWKPWINWNSPSPAPGIMWSAGPAYHKEIVHVLKQAMEWSRMPVPESEALALSSVEAAVLWCHARSRRPSSPFEEVLHPAIEAMTRHPEASYSISDLAKKCHLSESRFAHLFKQNTGASPRVFQEKIRMRMAKDLLKISKSPVQEIADQVGYEDPLYFSRRFRKEYGISPSKYRINLEEDSPRPKHLS